MNIIGLNGRMGSGKDTAVQYIEHAARPLRVERAAFADKLKMSAASALGFFAATAPEGVAICNELKNKARFTVTYADNGSDVVFTGREYLQWYGTEAHRDVFGPDFWVDALLPRTAHYDDTYSGVDLLVVTDVRFENEARRILDLGGSVWQIDADRRLGALSSDAHVSERRLPNGLITATISNNSTLEQFDAALTATTRMVLGC